MASSEKRVSDDPLGAPLAQLVPSEGINGARLEAFRGSEVTSIDEMGVPES